ncbi:MAG TPA: hypothetical protein VIJ40_03440 [Acidimicrobiales bacterium]
MTSPSGEQVTYVVKARRQSTTKNILIAAEQANRYLGNGHEEGHALIATQYISPRSREVLKDLGVNYVDTTGNVRLRSDSPGLFIEIQGANKDPWPDDTPLRSLGGRGAGRAMRALIDLRPPYGVRELSAKTNVPAATLSRVIDLLEREALLERDKNGGVSNVNWMGAIRRWSEDYELRKANTVDTYLEPRGIESLLPRLSEAKSRYAITSSLAAKWFEPIAPTRTAIIYVDNSAEFASELGIRSADSGFNIALAEPYDKVVFERTMIFNEFIVASPSQIAVDLMTGFGREPSEGEELLLWMERHQDAWRS